MSARNNYQDTTKYPKKITAADMDPAIVVPPAIPECPAAGANDVAYNLKVDADGFVEWEADAASTPVEPVQSDWDQTTITEPDYIKNKPTIVNVPTLPTADGDYKLHIAEGVATWVAITG